MPTDTHCFPSANETHTRKRSVNVLTPTLFSHHGQKMLKDVVAPLLSTSDVAHVSQTCQTMNHFFKKDLTKAAVRILLQHVIYGEEEKADALLRKNQHLLQHFLSDSDTVTDYSGQHIHGTAYQIALGAEDEKMVAMLQRHFHPLPTGCDAMRAQQRAQFSPESKIAWEKRQAKDRDILHRAAQAIANAPNAEACGDAIHTFRIEMDKPRGNEHGVICAGHHFNAQQLLEAFQLYAHRYAILGGWNSWRNELFMHQIIGYILRKVPACYAQAFSQGIDAIIDGREPLIRSFSLRQCPELVFYPLDLFPAFRLGFDYAAVNQLRPSHDHQHDPARLFSIFLLEKWKQLADTCAQVHANELIQHTKK